MGAVALPSTKVVSHAAYASRRGRDSDRVPARRPGGVRLVVAGRRPGSPTVLPRRRRVRRGPAPWSGRRRRGRRTGARARRRDRVVRRLGPGRWARTDDPDGRRLRRDAAAARGGRRRPRWTRHGRRRGRPGRRERGSRKQRLPRPPRRAGRRRPRGLRRPGRVAAGTRPGGCAGAGFDTRPRARRRTGRVRAGADRGAGDASRGHAPRCRTGSRPRRAGAGAGGDRRRPPRDAAARDDGREDRYAGAVALTACHAASGHRSGRCDRACGCACPERTGRPGRGRAACSSPAGQTRGHPTPPARGVPVCASRPAGSRAGARPGARRGAT